MLRSLVGSEMCIRDSLRFHADGTVHSFTEKMALIAKDAGVALTAGAPLLSLIHI